MVQVFEKKRNSKHYFYAIKSIRISPKKVKTLSLYLGSKRPSKKELPKFEAKIIEREFEKLLKGKKNVFLSKEELIKAELFKKEIKANLEKLSKSAKESFDKAQTIDFVYTTLRTENIDVSKRDVETSIELFSNSKKVVKSEKILICANMISGINFIKSGKKIDLAFVKKLHEIIMHSFESIKPGEIRDKQVYILKQDAKNFLPLEICYRPPEAQNLEKELNGFFLWLEQNKNLNALELAALVHLKFYKIHPFFDGNKRTARLLFNKILLDNNYPLINISHKSSQYFDSLIKSTETKKDNEFIKFVYKQFFKQYSKV